MMRVRHGIASMSIRTKALTIAFALFIAMALAAQTPYPQIQSLRPEDPLFAQLSESIERSRMAAKKGEGGQSDGLVFYCYRLPEKSNVFEIAAAFSLPYDTIATLNRLDGSGAIPSGANIVIPSAPGIFVPLRPESELEFLMNSLWRGETLASSIVQARIGRGIVGFRFYPGARFHPSERTFCLVAGFRFPLPKGVITSGFGVRNNPFTGRPGGFHTGIDIAAPYGTGVLASRAGRVEKTGYSKVYGNYVLISHGSEWETLYGHLSTISVATGASVSSGEAIGLVGSTGMSTGPHLHFETRRKGMVVDPAPLVGK
jgi:murein DD-endopeptidase MepM/ murein hydrolase activator NlpD